MITTSDKWVRLREPFDQLAKNGMPVWVSFTASGFADDLQGPADPWRDVQALGVKLVVERPVVSGVPR